MIVIFHSNYGDHKLFFIIKNELLCFEIPLKCKKKFYYFEKNQKNHFNTF